MPEYVGGTMKTKIRGTVEIELAIALWRLIGEKYEIDDAGCDLYTDGANGVYLGDNPEAKVADSPGAVALADAYNVLTYGRRLRINNPGGEEGDA